MKVLIKKRDQNAYINNEHNTNMIQVPQSIHCTCALMDGDFVYCVIKNTTAITGIMAKP